MLHPERVFPTPVGVFLTLDTATVLEAGLPHARGGVSMAVFPVLVQPPSSPRPWGCFFGSCIFALRPRVFPTPVGVFPLALSADPPIAGLPHARGGVSYLIPVFPTPVGVFLANKSSNILSIRLPHARGGVSGAALTTAGQKLSSPRPWGCFCYSYLEDVMEIVFPTPVGVFLTGLLFFLGLLSLPHARGGVSEL